MIFTECNILWATYAYVAQTPLNFSYGQNLALLKYHISENFNALAMNYYYFALSNNYVCPLM